MADHKVLHGADAIQQVELMLGRELTTIERRVVEEEGYVDGTYLDSKGILTSGVGQTGEWIEKGFEAALQHHVERAKGRVPKFDEMPEELQAELVQAEYRGDLGGSPKFLKLLNAGDYEAAANEFADNNDYRESAAGNGAIAGRMDRVRAAVRDYGPKVGNVLYANEETPFDPNDRGEMSQGFRHANDLTPTQPALARPEEVEGLMASTTPTISDAPEVQQEPSPEASPEVPAPTPAPASDPGILEVPEGTPPIPTYDDLQAGDMAARKRGQGISYMDLLNGGLRNDNAIGVFAHGLNEDFAPDSGFNGQAWFKENGEQIEALGGDAEEVGEVLGRAGSEEHAEYLLRKLQLAHDDEQMFAEAGLKGMAARLPAWLLDVDTLAAVVAPQIGVAKVGKLQGVVKAGLAAGLTNAGIEAYAAKNNPYRNGGDVAIAGLSGLFLGGAIGGIVTPTRKAAEAALVDDLVDATRLTIARNLTNDGNVSAAKRILGTGRDPDGPLAPRSGDVADEILEDLPDQEFAWGWINKLQRNFIGRLFFSENETIRKVSPSIMEGGLLKDKTATRAATAEGHMNNMFQTSMAHFYRSSLGDFRKWSERNGYGTLRREVGVEAGEKFYTEVAAALKGEKVSPEATAAAAQSKQLLDEVAKAARETGVPGFENPIENFFPRYWDDAKLTELSKKIDRDTQGLWFKQALLNKWDETNPRPDTSKLEDDLAQERAPLDDAILEAEERVRLAEEAVSVYRPREKGIGEAKKALKAHQKTLREAQASLKAFEKEADVRVKYAEAEIPQSTLDELAELRDLVESLRSEGGSRLREAQQRLFDAEEPVNKAIKRGSTREATAERIGIAFARAIARRNLGINDAMQRGLPLDDAERLHELFEGSGINKADIDELLFRLKETSNSKTKDAGNIRHGRQRLHFDETLKVEVATKDGGKMMLGLDDMTISDASKAIPRYLRTMSGWIGLAKESGIRGQKDINALLVKAAETGATKDETDALSDAFKLITGRSIEASPDGLGSQASRLMTSANYPRFGGSFGVAQLPEIGNPMGEVGILNFMKEIPDANKLFREAADGTLEDATAREIEELFGAGTDYLIHPARGNFSVEDGVTLKGKGRAKFDKATAVAGRLTAITSLMAPVNAFLERVSTRAIMRDWGRFAKGQPVPEWKKARLRNAGLSDADQAAVFAEISAKGKYDANGVLLEARPHTWDDPAVADKYRLALDRERRMTIQRNDIGNTGAYIHHPVGRILTQFMNFMLNSINKQLVRGVHFRDIQTWTSWNVSMFVGALAYTGQTQIDYANDPKRRKERMEPKRIAAAAYQRAGFSAITVPLIDSALGLSGFDQWFNYGRTSALGTDFLTGNASYTTATDLLYTATLPIRLGLNDDYEMSRQDTQRIWRMFPLQRTLGVKNGFHALEEAFDLPARPTSQ